MSNVHNKRVRLVTGSRPDAPPRDKLAATSELANRADMIRDRQMQTTVITSLLARLEQLKVERPAADLKQFERMRPSRRERVELKARLFNCGYANVANFETALLHIEAIVKRIDPDLHCKDWRIVQPLLSVVELEEKLTKKLFLLNTVKKKLEK